MFKARQVSLNRPVALKMILSSHLAGEDEIRRFKAEAESAAKLDQTYDRGAVPWQAVRSETDPGHANHKLLLPPKAAASGRGSAVALPPRSISGR